MKKKSEENYISVKDRKKYCAGQLLFSISARSVNAQNKEEASRGQVPQVISA